METEFHGVFVAERIVKRRHVKNGGGVEYLIKWKGWSPYHNTWEPEGNVLDKGLIAEYEAKQLKLKIKAESETDSRRTSGVGKVNEKTKSPSIPFTHYHTRKIESFINGTGSPKGERNGEKMGGSRKASEHSKKQERIPGTASHQSRPKTSISDPVFADSVAATLNKFSSVNQEFVKSQVQNVLAHCLLSQESDQALPNFVRSGCYL